MKCLLISLFLLPALACANAKVIGNGGDSLAINFKSVGHTLVFQLKAAASKRALGIDPEDFKKTLDSAQVESTTAPLFLEKKRKDAINYPREKRIVVNQLAWRLLSIQDKRTLVLHEVLGLMGTNDSTYQLSSNLEQMASVEVVPYFAGKDEDCQDGDHRPKPGEILDLELSNILVISDIYSATDRETYCTVTGKGPGQVLHRLSASFSSRCQKLFTEKKTRYRLRVVGDHICEIL